MVLSVNRIVGNLKCGYLSTRLSNALGTLNLMLGSVHEAVECQKFAQLAVTECECESNDRDIEIYSKMSIVKSSSLLNLGLCMLYLWELEQSLSFFQRAKEVSEENKYEKHFNNSLFCLALVNSCLGNSQKAISFAAQSELSRSLTEWGAGNKFLFLGQTYKNLGRFERAYEMYQQSILYAEESCYLQVNTNLM